MAGIPDEIFTSQIGKKMTITSNDFNILNYFTKAKRILIIENALKTDKIELETAGEKN